MELRHLRYFVAVAEELHFGRAAAKLHISQPPLSQQIKALEDELGVVLFHRTRRKVELSDAGRSLLDEARATLDQAARAERVARDAAAGMTGRLALAFVTSASFTILPGLIRAFRSAYPKVKLELHEMIPARQVAALDRKEMDVGLLRTPVAETCHQLTPLLREPLVAALPAGHRLAERPEIDLADLAEESFVLFPRRHGPGIYDVIMRGCVEAGFTPRVMHEPNEMQAILAFVAGGLGLSLVPVSLMGFHPDEIQYRPLTGNSPCVELALIRDPARDSVPINNLEQVCHRVAAAYQVKLDARLRRPGGEPVD